MTHVILMVQVANNLPIRFHFQVIRTCLIASLMILLNRKVISYSDEYNVHNKANLQNKCDEIENIITPADDRNSASANDYGPKSYIFETNVCFWRIPLENIIPLFWCLGLQSAACLRLSNFDQNACLANLKGR